MMRIVSAIAALMVIALIADRVATHLFAESLHVAFPSTPQVAFDGNAWREAKAVDDRQAMTEDLIAHHLRRGMSRRELETLLGPVFETRHSGEHHLDWALGAGPDRCLLHVDLDATGAFTAANTDCD